MDHRTPIVAFMCLVAAMSLTGANVAIGKLIVAEMPVYMTLGLRFAIAAVALGLLSRREPGPALTALSRDQVGTVLVLAGVGTVLFNIFLLEGTRRTAAGDAGIITATIPAVVAVLGLLVRGQRLGATQWVAIAAAVAGIVVMQSGAGHVAAATSSLLGSGLVACAVLCEAIFVMQSGRISGGLKPIQLSLAVALASVVLILPLAAADLATFDAASVAPQTWALVAWYAITSSVLNPILWFRAAAHVETWMAGLATAATPVAALAIATVLLAEPLGPYRLGGAALVIAAIVLGSLSGRTKTTRS